MSNSRRGIYDQGVAPYKGHKAMQCDITKSEHGTGTDAGSSKVTEGRSIDPDTGADSDKHGGKSKKKGSE